MTGKDKREAHKQLGRDDDTPRSTVADSNAVTRRITADAETMIADLQRLVRQPSVSATGEGLDECATLVCGMLADAGLESEILHLGRRRHDSLGGNSVVINAPAVKGRSLPPPVVYAERRSRANPKRTILFYNHYDVQPAEPLEQWRDPPFAGVRRGNRVYGRGAIDDKGELAARIHAVRSCIQETGDLPCNVKFVIEGEEETGSIGIPRYISKYRRKFACDGVIWEFGYVNPDGRPVVGLGMKGLMFVEMTARGPSKDVHSSLAVLIPNPAWQLVSALNTMYNPDGQVIIPGWYDGVRNYNAQEIDLLNDEPFDEGRFKKEFGITSFVGDKYGLDAKKALAGAPTCNIAGMLSGYTGRSAKTILPATATAKLDFRLVPGMVPLEQFERLRAHLASEGFADRGISVKMLHGEPAARTAPSERIVKDVARAAAASFGAKPVLSISNPATGPMHAFSVGLGAPCVSVGGTYVYSKIHSPNEFARIDLLKKTAMCMYRTMTLFGL